MAMLQVRGFFHSIKDPSGRGQAPQVTVLSAEYERRCGISIAYKISDAQHFGILNRRFRGYMPGSVALKDCLGLSLKQASLEVRFSLFSTLLCIFVQYISALPTCVLEPLPCV